MSDYDRRLGDVPGIDDIIPTTRALPYEGVSVLEVNGLGEVTAGEVGLGDITDTSYYNPDPFALGQGGEEDEPAGESQQGGSPSSGDGSAPSGTSSPSTPYAPSDVSPSPSSGTSSHAHGSFDEEQMTNAAAIAEVGAEVGASDRDIQIAFMAALVESQMRNLDYGDRDSIGMFQQRDAWGTFEDRMDPRKSARMFFLGGAAGQQGLLDIKDRDKRPMGEVAQDVQVSAYPERYAEREADAASIMASLGGKTFTGYVEGSKPTDMTTYAGKSVDMLTAAALDAAKKKFGADWHLMQGTHNHGGVAASGGTHDGGGVVDLAPENGDWVGAMTALRKIGFAAWIRNVEGYGQAGSGAHIHAVLMGHPELSPQAATQVQSYLNNDDGLVGSRADDGPRDWVNNRFVWDDVVKGANQAKPGGLKDPEDEEWRIKIGEKAQSYLGVDFKWGGEDHSGVDTVGLVRRIYNSLGVDLPRDIVDLAYGPGEPISVLDARKGDLIAFPSPLGEEGTRLGVYLGDNRVIEAGGPGRVVQITALDSVDPMAWAIPMKQYAEPSAPKTAAPYRPPVYTGGTSSPSPAGGYNPVGNTDYAPHNTYSGSTTSSGGGKSGGGGGPKPPKMPTPQVPDFGV